MSSRRGLLVLLFFVGCTSAKELGPGVYFVNKASSSSDPFPHLHTKARDLCGPAYLHSTPELFTESAIIGGTLYIDKGAKMTVVCASSPELAARYKAGDMHPSPRFPYQLLDSLRR